MGAPGLSIDIGTSGMKLHYFGADGGLTWNQFWPARADAEETLEVLLSRLEHLLDEGVPGLDPPRYIVVCALLGFLVMGEAGDIQDRWYWQDPLEPGPVSDDLRALEPVIGRSLEAGPYVLRLRRQDWSRSTRLTSVKDYVVGRLTGSWVMDPATASYTGLFSVYDAQWLASGIPHALPRLPMIVAADEVVGQIPFTSRWASGAEVLAGTVDGTAAMVGFELGMGDLGVVLGTTAVMFRRLPATTRPTIRGAVINCDPLSRKGRRTVLVGGPSAVFSPLLDRLAIAATAVPLAPSRLIWIPWMWPQRAPAWSPASWALMGAEPVFERVRQGTAWVEGIGLGLHGFVRGLADHPPCQASPRVVLGGGPASLAVAQILANVWDWSIEIRREGSVYGNWSLMRDHTQWTSDREVGRVGPMPQYRSYYAKVQALYDQAEPTVRRWVGLLREAEADLHEP